MNLGQITITSLGVLGLSCLGMLPARAQFTSAPIGVGPEETFNRAFFHNTGTFHDITGVSGQLNNIFGWRFLPGQPMFKGSYMDNLITLDSRLLGAMYEDYLRQQTQGEVIRTRDLPNPFSSSLQEESR